MQNPAVTASTMNPKTPAVMFTGNKKERREFPREKFGCAIPNVQVSTTAAGGPGDNLQYKVFQAESNTDTEQRQEGPPRKLSLQDLFCNPAYRLYMIGLMFCCFVILVAVILVVTILVTQSSDTSDDNDIVPSTISDGLSESSSSSSLRPTPSQTATGIEEGDALPSLSPTVTESPTSFPSSSETHLPSNTASPTSPPCTLCFQGESPRFSENGIGGPGTDSCMDINTVLSESYFTSLDDVCLGFNAQAYWACGCPTLPPPREEHLCSMCGDGSLPTNPDRLIDYGPGYPVWENLTCEAQAIRLTYAGVGSNWIPFQTCEGFQIAFGEICGCPMLEATADDSCPLCYGGEIPSFPDNLISGPGSQSCSQAIQFNQAFFKSSDDVCLGFNAQAYWTCGCPTMPPPREEHLCSMCRDGSLPTNPDTLIEYGPGYPVWENLTCKAQAIRLTYATPTSNWIPFQTCEGFQDAFADMCGC